MKFCLRTAIMGLCFVSAAAPSARAELTLTDLREQCEITQVAEKKFYSEKKDSQVGVCCTNPDKTQGWCCWETGSNDKFGRCGAQTPKS